MRRIILLTLLVLTATGGAAFADHYRRGEFRGDFRAGAGVSIRNPHDRIWTQRDHQRVYRRPVYINNGYYQFRNGSRYRYERPVIHRRYYDYRVRPQIVVENYQPVYGYNWVPGQWQWNGYEWIWTSGYYANDPSCDHGYNDGYNDSYDDGVRY
jgi:hypothetical protein